MQVPHSHLASKAAAGYHPLMTWVKGYAPGRPKFVTLLTSVNRYSGLKTTIFGNLILYFV